MTLEIAIIASALAMTIFIVVGLISENSARTSWQVTWRVLLNVVTVALGLWALIAAEDMLRHADRIPLYLLIAGGTGALIAAIAVPWNRRRWLFRRND